MIQESGLGCNRSPKRVATLVLESFSLKNFDLVTSQHTPSNPSPPHIGVLGRKTHERPL